MTRVEQESSDVVVVGSGPGGAVTAALLAEAGLDVTVCEEGPWVEHGVVPQFSVAQMDAQYRHRGLTAALGRPPIAYAEGRCAGGGSEVNSGLYHRPPDAVLDQWRLDYQVQDLQARHLAGYCERIEADLGVATMASPAPEASIVLDRGARALGWAVSQVPRWYAANHPVMPGRQTMTRTYLPRAQKAGARVVTDCRATRILHADGRARGVLCTVGSGDERRSVEFVAKAVVVSAGAVQTPALLQRSGVKGVGDTLQVHPTVKAVARFPFEVNDPDVPVHQVKEFAPDLSFGGSSSSPGQVALVLADDWEKRRQQMEHVERMAVYYAAVRPEGRGRVRVLPKFADPLVTYSITRRDLDLLRNGLARLMLLLLRSGAEQVWPSVRGADGVSDPATIPAAVRALSRSTASLMSVHLFSSVAMGERDACPADSFGRLKGFRNLYVNDASLLPTAPGVNPQGTIMAIAWRNAERWLDKGAFARG